MQLFLQAGVVVALSLSVARAATLCPLSSLLGGDAPPKFVRSHRVPKRRSLSGRSGDTERGASVCCCVCGNQLNHKFRTCQFEQ